MKEDSRLASRSAQCRCWCRCRPSAPTPSRAGRHGGRAGLDRARAARPAEVAGIVWDGDGRGDRRAQAAADRRMSSTARRSIATMRRFVDWVAAYTLSPPGMVARMVLRAPEAFDPEPLDRGAATHAARAGADDDGAARGCWSWPQTAWPGRAPVLPMRPACRRRHRRAERARRVRAGDDPAARRWLRRPIRASRAPRPAADQQAARPTALRSAVAAGAFRRHAARRRHRLGQDRGLFRGGRGGARRPASRC